MSQRHQQLRSGIARLRNALLPRQFDPTGQYRNPETTHLRTASFRVLAHAEIESFVEDIAESLYTEAWSLWKTYSWPSHTLTCLLAFSEVATNRPAEGVASVTASRYVDLAVPLQKASNAWHHDFRHNNGIKEANILRLFLPIGIDIAAIDQTLLNDLNSFGKRRGEIAHRSPTSVTTMLDPYAELTAVRSLVSALKGLDEIVTKELRRLQRASRRLAATSP